MRTNACCARNAATPVMPAQEGVHRGGVRLGLSSIGAMLAGFGPLPAELIELAAELESLGGGDARVGFGAVLCSVRAPQPGTLMIVEAEGDVIRVRDPRANGVAAPAPGGRWLEGGGRLPHFSDVPRALRLGDASVRRGSALTGHRLADGASRDRRVGETARPPCR